MLFLLNKEPLPEDICYALSPEKDSLSEASSAPLPREDLPLPSRFAGR